VASKEWVIRQYDHEVQGGSVIKPLVGVANDGPSDAAVLRPVLSSRAGLVDRLRHEPAVRRPRPVPHGGQRDRRGGAELRGRRRRSARIAILDNFCWGYTDRPETLGSLVRAALACRDVAVALGTPFISGKDSLNNEFSYEDARGPQSRRSRFRPRC
jgi:phosphoribosylformylglycinamidine synthase subunit PurSL